MGHSSVLVLGVGGMRVLRLRNVKGRRSEKGGESQTLQRTRHIVREAGREIVQLARFHEVGIGDGDGVGSESGSACAVTVDDDDYFETLDNGAVGLESAMIREKAAIVFDSGYSLGGVWAVTQNEDLGCADVLVYVPLLYPHDALGKVNAFDYDPQAFPHPLSSLDVGVWGLDFRRKILDLYVAVSQWGFLSDTVRAEQTGISDTHFLTP